MLRRMQTLVKLQAQARASRAHLSYYTPSFKSSLSHYPVSKHFLFFHFFVILKPTFWSEYQVECYYVFLQTCHFYNLTLRNCFPPCSKSWATEIVKYEGASLGWIVIGIEMWIICLKDWVLLLLTQQRMAPQPLTCLIHYFLLLSILTCRSQKNMNTHLVPWIQNLMDLLSLRCTIFPHLIDK